MEQPEGIADGRAEYPANFTRQAVPAAFQRAIDLLWPALGEYEGRHKNLIAALAGRVTWGQVKHWRKGRRATPRWARQILAQKAKEKAAALLDAAAVLESDN